MGWVLVLDGSGFAGHMVALAPGQSYTIGRLATGCDLAMPDKLLSRKHCTFDLTGAAPRVRDLGSLNGTYVNGVRVEERLLRDGDRAQLGSLVVRVVSVPDTDPEVGHSKTERARNFMFCDGCHRSLSSATASAAELCRLPDGRVLCPQCRSAEPTEADLVAGFRMMRKLGEGAAGTVFLARQLDPGRDVALKLLRGGRDASEKMRRRFLREARIGVELDHPNIVRVFGIHAHRELLYIVMEYVAGRGLDRIIDERPLSLAETVSLFEQVLQALDYAHQMGVIHRDLKPSNIIVTAEGRAKLADFGLAKHLERIGMSVLTERGESLGTPHCMPPEQVMDAALVSPRSDLYAVGASLYRMVCGRYPIDAATYHDFIEQVVSGSPKRVEELAPRAPRALAQAIHRALAKKPEERFASAREMREALLRAAQATE